MEPSAWICALAYKCRLPHRDGVETLFIELAVQILHYLEFIFYIELCKCDISFLMTCFIQSVRLLTARWIPKKFENYSPRRLWETDHSSSRLYSYQGSAASVTRNAGLWKLQSDMMKPSSPCSISSSLSEGEGERLWVGCSVRGTRLTASLPLISAITHQKLGWRGERKGLPPMFIPSGRNNLDRL